MVSLCSALFNVRLELTYIGSNCQNTNSAPFIQFTKEEQTTPAIRERKQYINSFDEFSQSTRFSRGLELKLKFPKFEITFETCVLLCRRVKQALWYVDRGLTCANIGSLRKCAHTYSSTFSDCKLASSNEIWKSGTEIQKVNEERESILRKAWCERRKGSDVV